METQGNWSNQMGFHRTKPSRLNLELVLWTSITSGILSELLSPQLRLGRHASNLGEVDVGNTPWELREYSANTVESGSNFWKSGVYATDFVNHYCSLDKLQRLTSNLKISCDSTTIYTSCFIDYCLPKIMFYTSFGGGQYANLPHDLPFPAISCLHASLHFLLLSKIPSMCLELQ